MRLLPEQQRAFGAALVRGVTPSQRRFAAYRRNFWANHRDPLSATYRVVEMLVGPAVFRELANAYVEAHPSGNADLNLYGGDFGDFLAAQSLSSRYPYLPDMARVEWALLEAYGSADSPPFALEALAAVPPNRHADIRLLPSPGIRLLASDYPLTAIWHAHQIDDEAERDAVLAAIDLAPRAGWTLVARSAGDTVQPFALTAGEVAFCRACRDGLPLGTALASALAAEPELAADTLLSAWVGCGWISDFSLD
jgi:hypothetical protein